MLLLSLDDLIKVEVAGSLCYPATRLSSYIGWRPPFGRKSGTAWSAPSGVDKAANTLRTKWMHN
jgi:hypothetical protein